MTAISSMSAPVNANPLDDVGALTTFAVVVGPSDGVAAGVVVMPVVGVVQPV
jgi:hypothetical protein